jgi:L-fucose isomerase-like protein
VLHNSLRLTVAKLHELLSIEKSSLWLNTLAKELETLGEIEVFADGEEEEQTDGRDVVLEMEQNEMVHLLQHGLPDEEEM